MDIRAHVLRERSVEDASWPARHRRAVHLARAYYMRRDVRGLRWRFIDSQQQQQ